MIDAIFATMNKKKLIQTSHFR